MTTMTQSRHKALAAAIKRVLTPKQRAAARELCSIENGRRCSTQEVMSWMRMNMPSAADRVDDVLFPEPFRD